MKEQIIYQIPHIYRDNFRVRAFTFGEGEKALCIIGSMRGNEFQQPQAESLNAGVAAAVAMWEMVR